jgi:hypothetical protein
MRAIVLTCVAFTSLLGCGSDDSDAKQQEANERILSEGTAQTGMPAIHNFRERHMLKEILELRDQDGLVTYTYLFSQMTGQLVPFCESIGYGFPAATQYTNPQKITGSSRVVLPQADPNGLFSPASAEGTWVLCKDPNGKETRPVYVEERVVVAPFRMEHAATAAEKTEPSRR